MAGKRGNGEGSIRQRANGTWEARVMLDGRSKSVFGRTRQDAHRKLAAVIRHHDQGLPILTGKAVTLASFLNTWLAMKRGTRSYRTWKGYEALVRNHIAPTLGRLILSKLTAQHVQQFYTAKLQEGLSSTTCRHIHAALHTALEHALMQGLVSRNVCDLVEAPQFAHTDRVILTADEAKRLLAAAKDTRWEPIYVLALTTGLREGELLGLRWRFVDLGAGTLTVSGNVQPGHNGLTLKEPKNASSVRTVKLTSLAVEALRQHRVRQAREREKAGEHWREHDLVFPTTVGTLTRCQDFYARHYRPLLAKAGVPSVRFHDLRHSAATLLIASGVPLPIVSQILGHSTTRITADLYTHVSLAMQQQAVDNMDALLGTPEPQWGTMRTEPGLGTGLGTKPNLGMRRKAQVQ